MGASARDLENVTKLTARAMAVAKIFVPLLLPIFRLGFVRRRFDKTLSGRIGTITRLSQRGRHVEAAALATEVMKECWEQKPSARVATSYDYRWYVMRLAAEALERCRDHERLDGLIEWANAETERGGDDNQAAHCYLAFSNAMYRRKAFGAALRYAKIAAEADKTWAVPDYHLGWYALVLDLGDALEHLTRAVRRDPRILAQIEANDDCNRHPHIIEKLKRVAAESGTTSESEPSA